MVLNIVPFLRQIGAAITEASLQKLGPRRFTALISCAVKRVPE